MPMKVTTRLTFFVAGSLASTFVDALLQYVIIVMCLSDLHFGFCIYQYIGIYNANGNYNLVDNAYVYCYIAIPDYNCFYICI